MRFLWITLFFTISTYAANWSDLEVGNRYKLIQSFELPQAERSRSNLTFVKGQTLRLNEVSSMEIPGAFLSIFKFEYEKCTGPQMATDMIIIPVENSFPLVEVGAEVSKCELVIYMETKDYYNKSLFE